MAFKYADNIMNYGFSDIDIGKLIQISVAPVFLLAGIGAIISILSARITRIIDVARQLDQRLDGVDEVHHNHLNEELRALSYRSKVAGWSITLCVISELFICILIALHFIGGLFQYSVSLAVAILFVISMLFLVAGLIFFLHEIFISTMSIRMIMEKIYFRHQK
ncbi:DUF2721 domain-containing protein [Candidatus Methylospira mobilis]|uniref:DUF2721 domain-containing protein n=1 Tax=Candidatus Methylospira mobilis TaxID=1808979 RepID=A0A5Q0BL94_9GAMM|nr:DUF2721 domain-containing protein [Candidatus Methylospira mobilis]QFY42877.1 DUF2721 domain-containing protein [Candidatus Methylospira mobilis]WNV04064.1 DUF2721 domain-containing protein [Candidatus Methylospira mobilis]